MNKISRNFCGSHPTNRLPYPRQYASYRARHNLPMSIPQRYPLNLSIADARWSAISCTLWKGKFHSLCNGIAWFSQMYAIVFFFYYDNLARFLSLAINAFQFYLPSYCLHIYMSIVERLMCSTCNRIYEIKCGM